MINSQKPTQPKNKYLFCANCQNPIDRTVENAEEKLRYGTSILDSKGIYNAIQSKQFRSIDLCNFCYAKLRTWMRVKKYENDPMESLKGNEPTQPNKGKEEVREPAAIMFTDDMIRRAGKRMTEMKNETLRKYDEKFGDLAKAAISENRRFYTRPQTIKVLPTSSSDWQEWNERDRPEIESYIEFLLSSQRSHLLKEIQEWAEYNKGLVGQKFYKGSFGIWPPERNGYQKALADLLTYLTKLEKEGESK